MPAVKRLARSVAVDISTDGTTWLRLKGRTDNAPQITPNKVDSTDTDSNGFTSAEITLQSGVLTVKGNTLETAGVPDAAWELVEGCVGQFADSARLYVRWYDLDGGSRGWTARAIVEVSYSKTGVADLREVTATFTLDGAITKMTGAQITTAIGNSALPVITSAAQTGTGVGSQVQINGANFTGATSAKFGATSATQFRVVSDSVIVAVVPTGGTGSQSLTVTTPAGISTGFAFTVS
jgi:hypothetical protein